MNSFYAKAQIPNDATGEPMLTVVMGDDKPFKDVTVNINQCMKATVAVNNLLWLVVK